MGRGVSAGGGQSSLGYLFGSGETPKPAEEHGTAAPQKQVPVSTSNDGPPQKSTDRASSSPVVVGIVTNEIPAGIQGSQATITSVLLGKTVDPGGGSSLGYLFGGGGGS